MRLLAIDTSSKSVSVALLQEGELILEIDSRKKATETGSQAARLAAGTDDNLPPSYARKRSKGATTASRVFAPGASVLLAPMIRSLLRQTAQEIGQIDLITVAIGPGSFTGLRVGVVTAKSLAYSTGAATIGVNTLEVIAARTAIEMNDFRKPIKSVLNAQRQQLFSGCFRTTPDWQVEEIQSKRLSKRETWIKELQPGDVVTGSGLRSLEECTDFSHLDVSVAPENCWESSASEVGRRGWRQYEVGQRDDFWKLEPLYFRPSTAEEVLAARNKDDKVP